MLVRGGNAAAGSHGSSEDVLQPGANIAYFAYNLLLHPLASVPGPLSARLGIPWFRSHATLTNSYSWRIHQLHDLYGSVVRVGPNFVDTIEPETVRKIYVSGEFRKTDFYHSFCAQTTLFVSILQLADE